MARYYFHYWHRGSLSVPDDDCGIELPNIKPAHQHALKLVQQTLPLFDNADEARGWSIEVAEGQDRHVLTVLFPAKGTALYGVVRALRSVPPEHVVDGADMTKTQTILAVQRTRYLRFRRVAGRSAKPTRDPCVQRQQCLRTSGMMSDERLEAACSREVGRSDWEVAEACVEAMARHLALGESEVIWCLEQEDWIGALVVIAKLADLDSAQAAAAFDRGSVHGQLVLMRAAGLSWPVVEWILAERSTVHGSEMELHKALYLSLPALRRAQAPQCTDANANVVQFEAARKRRASSSWPETGGSARC